MNLTSGTDATATADNSSTTETDTRYASASAPAPSVFLADADFCDVFMSANLQAWTKIVNDPLLALPQSLQGSILLQYARCLVDHCDVLKDTLFIYDGVRNLFVKRALVSESDRECLMMEIQSLRMSNDVVQDFVNFATFYLTSADIASCKQLFQVWFRKLTIELINCISSRLSSMERDARCVEPLTEIDQNILYHVCGYMAMKVKTACRRYKKMQNLQGLTECLTSKEPKEQGHFVEKYKQWVEKQNRGGLLYPVPNYYLLVREFDSIFRSHVNANGVKASSVCKSLLLMTMHDSFMVNYYWNKTVEMSHLVECNTLPVLDYLMSLFITIKGFALARKERDRLTVQRQHDKKVNQSKSLRGKLKKN